MSRTKAAIIGSGNIGIDLMIKVLRTSDVLEMGAMVGIDPDSDGLARARRIGVPTTSDGIDGLIAMPGFDEIGVVFDATSAGAHLRHDALLRQHGKQVVDLTPAAIGPFVVPAVNLDAHLASPNVNMVTCGGQATVPVVAAVTRRAPVITGELAASIAPRRAGPLPRANIDEFTETTSRAVEQVGGARRGKAIIVLNPAEPPLIMRDTVICLAGAGDPALIADSVTAMVAEVAAYVPGYRLRHPVQIDPVDDALRARLLPGEAEEARWKVTALLEVEGAGHYLPAYAGNLDIMTSAALRVAERVGGVPEGAAA
ncbi:acetaldehyde dehydrogenase (acetylating) [Streptomyces sp. NPDC059131]|uniref:acetaldehyde dehydrogenase (acetylating) n=1 Tax=Streptomyces sp. NPDC059131 TaxID=3346736 RepID=UPI003698799F